MDLHILNDEFSMAELMAPSSEFSFIQDPKFYVDDVPAQQEYSNSIQASDVFNGLDVSVQQPQLDSFQSPDTKNHMAGDDVCGGINEQCATMYGQLSATSPLPYGMNRNTPANIMHPNDEFLFDGMNRDIEELKGEHSLRVEYSDSPYPAENLFSSQKLSQPTTFPSETRDAFAAQVHDGYYSQKAGMIPSVVDHGAEALATAAAAAVKNEHQAQSRQKECSNLLATCAIDAGSASRRSSRRRNSKGPKPKLHQRTEPYPDAGMETKRKNAIKARKNRIKAKEEKETMEAEISRLKTLLLEKDDIFKGLLQEKDDIIKGLKDEMRLEKKNRIRVLQEELARLTVPYNSL